MIEQKEDIKIEELEDRTFKITRVITEIVEPKNIIEIIKQIEDGKKSLEKQKEDNEKGLNMLSPRLEEFKKAEGKARVWVKEDELKNLRKGGKTDAGQESKVETNYAG